MDKQYDIIVIGAGNGGLSAAASACKRGFRTLLIEQHNLPGGFATSFRRGRFEFAPALHELCDVGEPDSREEVGALLFLVSDVVLILNTFGAESRRSLRITNIALYYVGQLLIALSLRFLGGL